MKERPQKGRREQQTIDIISQLLDVKTDIQREITGSGWKCPIIDKAIYEIVKLQTELENQKYFRKLEEDENKEFMALTEGIYADQLSEEEWNDIHEFIVNRAGIKEGE